MENGVEGLIRLAGSSSLVAMSVSRRAMLSASGLAVAAAGVAALPATAQSRSPQQSASSGVRTGADTSAATHWRFLAGRRVGVITNQTGVLEDFTPIVNSMVADGVDVRVILAPEFGYTGGGADLDDATDPSTGITIENVFQVGAAEWDALLSRFDLDTIVFDVAQLGARYESQIWTLWAAMRALAKRNQTLVVLDRPNPAGGQAYGPVLESTHFSDVGLVPLALQHGLTVGELAGYFRSQLTSGSVQLQVAQADGWTRQRANSSEDGLLVPVRPKVTSICTGLLYPGMELLSAAHVACGTGTDRPYEVVGAPYFDDEFVRDLQGQDLPGVRFRPITFRPTAGPFRDELCHGVQIHVTSTTALDPIRIGVSILSTMRRRYLEFSWRILDNGANDRGRRMELLTGEPRTRVLIGASAHGAAITDSWQAKLHEFRLATQSSLLYAGGR